MYCRGFSFDLVTRVWDIFFNEGYKIVYRVALALVKVRSHVCTSNVTNVQQFVWVRFAIYRYLMSAAVHCTTQVDLLVLNIWLNISSSSYCHLHLHLHLSFIQHLKFMEKEILANKFEEILGIFRSMPKRLDAEKLMELAWTIPLRSDEIIKYEKKVNQ